MSRTSKILVNLEDTYDLIIEREAHAEDVSVSSYTRDLILDGLKARGLINDRLIAAVARDRIGDIEKALEELEREPEMGVEAALGHHS